MKYCELYQELKRHGELVSGADLLITAIAIISRRTLVTKDKDFECLKKYGLHLELRN